MPWKERYTISDEKSIVDADIKWPGGKRCCFRVVVDLSPACGPEGIKPDDLTTPDAYYGMHGGLDALVGVLDRYGIKATFAVPAVIAEIQADKLKRLAGAGHEIAAHGFKHEDVSQLDKDEERARLGRTTEILARVAGQRPVGWFSLARPSDKFAGGAVSPHTIDLLLEGGYEYFGNGLADDAPHYWVSDFASRRAILALPYYYHFDDQFFLLFPRKGTGLENPNSLYRNWKAELDAQYKRGRHFSIVRASARHRLAQPPAHARAVPRPCAEPARAVVRHQRGLCAALVGHLPGRDAPQARTVDLARITRAA